MKIESVRIENFRSFKDETIIFDDYTCFVGANGSGKSTVLNALNVFFRQYKDSKTDLSKLDKEDFHHKNTDLPVKITVTFIDLCDAAKKELGNYVRQGKLIVSALAKYDYARGYAEVKQYGNRLGFEDFRRFFEADKEGVKVADLKEIYAKLKEKYSDLPSSGTKQQMIDDLQQYEANHISECILIPSEDQFYGISKGANRLAHYIQWIFVPASKDITEEKEEIKNSALSQLLERTVRAKVNFSEKVVQLKKEAQSKYQEMLDIEQATLKGLSASLQRKLESWAHPGISTNILWKQDAETSIKVEEPWAYIKFGERDFEGDLTRFGLGLQRSYMLALLQELTTMADKSAPSLVMGIEEPEIFQHPPQSRHLAETLYDLSMQGAQIMICTHCPLFVPGANFEAVRVIREKGSPSQSYSSQLSYKELASVLKDSGQKALKEEGMLAKLFSSLNPITSEMFFCKSLVLTEGIEDVAYLTAYLALTGKMQDFRKHGCHIVPVGGKDSIVKPLAMAKLLNIPVFVMCDADTDKTKPDEIIKHKNENKAILSLLGYNTFSEWPTNSIFEGTLVMWKTNLTEEIHNELNNAWQQYEDGAYQYYGTPGGLKKNPLAIARALEAAWYNNIRSKMLLDVIDKIIKHLEDNSSAENEKATN